MKRIITDFFGDDPQASPDYGRIVNARHHRRLIKLIPGSGEIYAGGVADEADRYIAPTILRNVPADAPAMADEIFGPILPVIHVTGIDQAIDFVNNRPKPLALYVFTSDPAVAKTCSPGPAPAASASTTYCYIWPSPRFLSAASVTAVWAPITARPPSIRSATGNPYSKSQPGSTRRSSTPPTTTPKKGGLGGCCRSLEKIAFSPPVIEQASGTFALDPKQA